MNSLHPHDPYQSERNRAGLTPEEAVEKLPFGLHTLQHNEAGRHHPKRDHADAMAELYGCGVNGFAQWKGVKNDA